SRNAVWRPPAPPPTIAISHEFCTSPKSNEPQPRTVAQTARANRRFFEVIPRRGPILEPHFGKVGRQCCDEASHVVVGAHRTLPMICLRRSFALFGLAAAFSACAIAGCGGGQPPPLACENPPCGAATNDRDGDGLPDELDPNPDNPDTDGDGLCDGNRS